ncbi:tripartite tricarboxylate transporter substrate binding protein [Acidovorax sp. SUPP3434]|uniref:Bug family tripartite tricarboxylate transporter substrate binding protein n=1 Tax=Acidovorax sp. SUPP3434 TaxID=2920880 RepID=UPI0023DE2363|nr:tripartite tricarboxylate transporter substrate binding protein [Acidovorax sp. SUPP3434]GKS98752.1 tripartite tricarboxylate transporter substrate binding protein [Acidovorax sp. SUPP3434]
MNAPLRPASLSRRRWLQTVSLTPSVALLPDSTRAAPGYPDHPIRLVVPSAAGGSPDAVCRILTNELPKALGQPFVVDNKPGASGNIGMADVFRAPADGYTLGYANVGTLAINKALYSKLPYDPDALVSIGLIGFVQNALVVRKDLPVQSVKDLIALARAKPGELTVASGDSGTTGHLSGELFKASTQVSMTHIPYKGSPQAITDLMGGVVDLMFDNLSSILPHIQSGRVRVLAVTGAARSPQLPQLPTVAEAGVQGYETVGWGGIVAPPGTPSAIAAQLNKALNDALRLPPVQEKYAALGFELTPGPPERLIERARKESPMWADVVKRSGAQVG